MKCKVQFTDPAAPGGALDIDLVARQLRLHDRRPGRPRKHVIDLDDVLEVEAKSAGRLTIRLKSGEAVELHGLKELYTVLNALAQHVADVTAPHVRAQLVEHEQRRLHLR